MTAANCGIINGHFNAHMLIPYSRLAIGYAVKVKGGYHLEIFAFAPRKNIAAIT